MWAAAQFRHQAPALYHAPGLWGTTDGVVPYRRFWVEYVLMASHLARQRLQVAAAVTLATGGEEAEAARAETRGLASPELHGG